LLLEASLDSIDLASSSIFDILVGEEGYKRGSVDGFR